MDHLRNNRVSVTTVMDGFCCSAATFILLGGTYRVAQRHSSLLVHQVSTGFWVGRFSDLQDEMHNSATLMRTVKGIYAERTNLNATELDALLRDEKNVDAEACLAAGFVQELW